MGESNQGKSNHGSQTPAVRALCVMGVVVDEGGGGGGSGVAGG